MLGLKINKIWQEFEMDELDAVFQCLQNKHFYTDEWEKTYFTEVEIKECYNHRKLMLQVKELRNHDYEVIIARGGYTILVKIGEFHTSAE